MNQVYIFCASYGEIKRTLYLAEQYCIERPVIIIIPGMNDIYLFFQAIIAKNILSTNVNLVYFEKYLPGRAGVRGIRKLLYIIPDILKERRHLGMILKRTFTGVKGCDVYFCSRGFDGYIFYLVKKLSKMNRIVNTSPSPPQLTAISKYTPTNIADLARLIIYKLIYGHDIALGKFPHLKGFIYMTDEFMAKTVNKIISWEEIETMMKSFDYDRFRVFATSRYRAIYFDDSSLAAGYIADKEIYRNQLKEIFDILAKYFPENEIARKYHPSYPDDKTLITVGEVLPDFIPAELLYDKKVRLYLSIGSYSLANVEAGLAVSILDLITFKDEIEKEWFKNMLIKMGKSKILFPKSLDEFERICIDLKGEKGSNSSSRSSIANSLLPNRKS